MIKNSTLFYLVDDLNSLSDILFTESDYESFEDNHVNLLLDLLEYDPGEELVTKTLQKAII